MGLMSLRALNGHRLNTEMSGKGPPVLAIHGFTGNLHSWESLAEAAADEFRLLRVDMLGHGKSDSPGDSRLYDMEHTAAALAEVIDSYGLPHAHWLGYSMGGRIALASALARPERVMSLILESASAGIADVDEREARRLSDEELAVRIDGRGIEDFVQYWESLPMWQTQDRLSPEVRAALHKQRLSNNANGLAGSLRGAGTGTQEPFLTRLSELRMPVMLIAGADDAKFCAVAREMQSRISRSSLTVVPHSGHSVHLEQPEVFNQAVLAFLRGVSRRALAQPVLRDNPPQAEEAVK